MPKQESNISYTTHPFHAPNYNGPFERTVISSSVSVEKNMKNKKIVKRTVTVINVHRPKS